MRTMPRVTLYLNSVGMIDNYTLQHSLNVAGMAVAFAEYLGMPPYNLYIAAISHDIGKIGIGAGILAKPGSLDENERLLMNMHPVIGANIMRATYDCPAIVAGIEQHHEAWDGSGYPAKLRGNEISYAARILAIIDSFDAMTSERTYHMRRKSVMGALAEIKRCAGTQFDPELAELFCVFMAPSHTDLLNGPPRMNGLVLEPMAADNIGTAAPTGTEGR